MSNTPSPSRPTALVHRSRKRYPKPQGVEEIWAIFTTGGNAIRRRGKLLQNEQRLVTNAIGAMARGAGEEANFKQLKYTDFLRRLWRTGGPEYAFVWAAKLGKAKAADMKQLSMEDFFHLVEQHPHLFEDPVFTTLIRQHQFVNQHNTAKKRERPNPTNPTNPTNPEPEPFYDNASLRGIASVFKEDINSAIRKEEIDCNGFVKDAIRMTVPRSGVIHCVLGLAIDKTKVSFITDLLWGIKLKESNGARCIAISEYATADFGLELKLKGCPDDVIKTVFGVEIYEGIAVVPEQGVLKSHGITIIISRNTQEGAVINLNLSRRGACNLGNRLFEWS